MSEKTSRTELAEALGEARRQYQEVLDDERRKDDDEITEHADRLAESLHRRDD